VGLRRLIVVFVVAAAVLAGCGGGSGAPSRATSSAPVVDTASAPVPKRQRPRVPTGPRNAPVPILMYHVIASPPAGTPYPELWVSPSSFARQVAALAHAG